VPRYFCPIWSLSTDIQTSPLHQISLKPVHRETCWYMRTVGRTWQIEQALSTTVRPRLKRRYITWTYQQVICSCSFLSSSSVKASVPCVTCFLRKKNEAVFWNQTVRAFLTWCFSDRASWIDYILITNLMHRLLFIHKILFSSTRFEP